MESFYFLIPIALIFVAIAIRFLYWAITSGQYDNLDTEAHRILFDEDLKPQAETDKTEADATEISDKNDADKDSPNKVKSEPRL